MVDDFGSGREHLRVERGGRFGLAALPRDLRVLEFVIGVARRAAHLLHVVTDHRHDYVVGHAPLARTIIVQNVTKPKLALLHQRSRRYRWQGMNCERRPNISRGRRGRPATLAPRPTGPEPRPARSTAASVWPAPTPPA